MGEEKKQKIYKQMTNMNTVTDIFTLQKKKKINQLS